MWKKGLPKKIVKNKGVFFFEKKNHISKKKKTLFLLAIAKKIWVI
jgi:hypothetical protein